MLTNQQPITVFNFEMKTGGIRTFGLTSTCIHIVSTADLALGNLTFAMGSTINTVVCGNVVEVLNDTVLENEETFSIFVSDILTPLENSALVDIANISLSAVLPCENLTITVSTSDTEGQQ